MNILTIIEILALVVCTWVFVMAVAGIIRYYIKDSNDQKLRKAAKDAKSRQNKRFAEMGDEGKRLEVFAETGELPTAKERITTLTQPSVAPKTGWFDELLDKYQFSMEIDADAGEMMLVDRKFFALPNKVVKLPVAKALGVDYKGLKQILIFARSTINRRAQRAGMLNIKHRNGGK